MLNKLTSRFFLLLLLAAGVASCESTTENPDENAVIKRPSLLVLNEGAFNGFNASLDAINTANGERKANILPNLGDVGSDVELINGKIYVVSSNSSKMYAIDPIDGVTLASLNFTQPSSPNAIAKINDNEAIVTHLFSNRLDVIDLTTNTVKDSIRVGQGTVDIAVMNGFAYITAYSNVLYVVDLSTKALVDSVMIGDVPQRVIADPTRSQVVTLSWGMWPNGIANVSIINANTRTVTKKTEVASSVQKLIPAGNRAFIIYGDKVESMDLVSGIPISVSSSGYLGGVYDAPANELYLGSGNYTSAGKVDVLDASSGVVKRSYEAGIAPAHFAFYR